MTIATWTLRRGGAFYATIVLSDGRAHVSVASDQALLDRLPDALKVALDGWDPVEGFVTVLPDGNPERVAVWVSAYVQARQRADAVTWDCDYNGPELFAQDEPLPAGAAY